MSGALSSCLKTRDTICETGTTMQQIHHPEQEMANSLLRIFLSSPALCYSSEASHLWDRSLEHDVLDWLS